MKHARITHELIYAIQADRHLSKYLHLIKDAPAYPIIYDSKDRVLSMPPIINSQRKSRHRSPLHCIYGKQVRRLYLARQLTSSLTQPLLTRPNCKLSGGFDEDEADDPK